MKIYVLLIMLFVSFLSVSCFKDYNERFIFEEKMVEFDAVVPLNNVALKDYAIHGTIQKLTSGVVKYQVNKFGKLSDQDELISFKVDEQETTAVEGVDYRLPEGKVFTVPAHSSQGFIQIQVLASIQDTKLLVLELVGNESVKAAKLYKKMGIRLSK